MTYGQGRLIFVYYNIVLKMSYPLLHTVVNKTKNKINRNKLLRSVANGKQLKHQNTLSNSSQFMVKRLVSCMNFRTCKTNCIFFSSSKISLPSNKVSSSIGKSLLISRIPIRKIFLF
jgi:hypothetical protein